MRLIYTSICVFFFQVSAFTQAKEAYFDAGKWLIGIKAGAALSSIDGIKSTLIREWYPDSTFTAEKKYRWGATGGVFFYYRFKNSAVAFQQEITYAMQGSRFHYTDSILLSPIDTVGLDYEMKFRYQYLNIMPMLKIYPFFQNDNFLRAINLNIGLQLGINVAQENIKYESNKPYLGPDLQIEENLRSVLKGRTDVAVVLGISGELKGKIPLSFDGRVNLGLADTIETLANGYNFIQNRNPSISFQLSVGYAWQID